MASLRKLPSKLWQVQVRLAGFTPVTASFPTKREAKAWGAETETALKRGITPKTVLDVRSMRGLTLSDLVQKWVVAKRPKSYDAAINSILRDPLAKLFLTEISKERVMEWKNRQLETVLGSSVAKYVRVPRGAWEYGLDVLELPLGRNPFLRIGIRESKRRRHRRLGPGEYELLMAHGEDWLKEIIDFALETGMRRGEIARISLSHLRQNGRFLWIPETKTDRPRSIPLTKKAQEILSRREVQGAYFGRSVKSITNSFVILCKRAGLVDFHFHDLRHEALSRLNDKGLSPFDLRLISGHRTTEYLDVYIQPDLERVAKLLAA